MGTYVHGKYAKGYATFRSDSVSTIGVLKEVLSEIAASTRIDPWIEVTSAPLAGHWSEFEICRILSSTRTKIHVVEALFVDMLCANIFGYTHGCDRR